MENKDYKYLYNKYKNKYFSLKEKYLKNQLGGANCDYVNILNKDDCRDKTKYTTISSNLQDIIKNPACTSNKQKAEQTLTYCNKLYSSVNIQSNSLPEALAKKQTSMGYVVPPQTEATYVNASPPGSPTMSTYDKFKNIK